MSSKLLPIPTFRRGDQPLTIQAMDVRWGIGRWPSGRVWLPPRDAALSIRKGELLDLHFAGRRLPLLVRRTSAPVIGAGTVVLDLVDPLESAPIPGFGIAEAQEVTLDEVLKRLAGESAVTNSSAMRWRARGIWCACMDRASAVAVLAADAGSTFWRDPDGGLNAGMPDDNPCDMTPVELHEENGDRWFATLTAGAVPDIGAVVTAAGRNGRVRALRLIDDGQARTLRVAFGTLGPVTAPSAWSRLLLRVGRVIDPVDPIVEVMPPSGQPQRILGTLLEPKLKNGSVAFPLTAGDPVLACLPWGTFVGPIPVFPWTPSKAGDRPEGLVAALEAMKIDTKGSILLTGGGIKLDPLDGYVEIP